VTGVFIYPVKSLRGIAVNSAQLTALGCRHDRQWMLVSADGRFLTQREWPRMALIQTRLGSTGVELSLQGHGNIQVPFKQRQGRSISTSVWGDAVETTDQGDEVSAWLGQALAMPEAPRLVRMRESYQRPQRRPERYGPDTTTVFADGAPYLVANQASLEALNRELLKRGHAAVPMDRFRANIVVAGLPAFAEHQHALLEGPGYQLDLRYPCERCSVTTVDQALGIADEGQQPWRTLREINPMPNNARAAAFAQNSVLSGGAGASVRVGDKLRWQAL
jgi:uncharacterized protein YcbX